MPMLAATYGPRRDVTEYPTCYVLQEQFMEAFEDRVHANAQYLMSKRPAK